MQELWQRYQKYYCEAAGVIVDISRMNFSDDFFAKIETGIQQAFTEMEKLERGAIANPDENRMVGHYWLRNFNLAPTNEIQRKIETMQRKVCDFTNAVHKGQIAPEHGGTFRSILSIGIGGSALGPHFLAHALGTGKDKMKPYFLDNTDPDGMDRVFAALGDGLKETLTLVISKSGNTPETRNGMLEAKAAYQRKGLTFAKHAVAITGDSGDLCEIATKEQWLDIFPMWDWIGGRSSVMSAVGLLPARLQGIDVDGILNGAREMDEATRKKNPVRNPAALLALMWYHAGQGRGLKSMVILPYKDRLELFSRYLQQLVMESLGKEFDRRGRLVNQGIAVYGNKGSTDQHAYVQQLREGVNNFFATFIEVLKDRDGDSIPVWGIELENGARISVTAGDYLSGFLQGTRDALFENQRESISITVLEVNAENVGKIIALFERAVGFYGSLVNVNAYHQPGVEAGKRAAEAVLKLQAKTFYFLKQHPGTRFSLDDLAEAIGQKTEIENLYKVLRHLATNGSIHHQRGTNLCDGRYWV